MKTLIEALPRDEIGIPTPLFGEGSDGEMYPVYVYEDYLEKHYSDYLLLPVPLSEEDYYNIILKSTPAWQKFWQAWRMKGII